MEKYEDSLNIINQSLDICDYDGSWELKTKLSYILGDFKNTLKASNHVLISNPLNIEIWFYKINSLIYLNKLEEALNSCNEVLKYDFSEYFIYKKASILLELNRFEESIKICDIFHQRRYDAGECAADDNTDCHVHDIATTDECFEFIKKFFHVLSPSVIFFHIITEKR